jgi:integrase
MAKSAQSKQPKQPTLKVRNRDGRDSYYANIKGKQYVFGYVSRDEAERLFAAKLNEVRQAAVAGKPRPQLPPLTVRQVISRFLEWVELDPDKNEETREFYRSKLAERPKSDESEQPKPDKAKRKQFVSFLDWLNEKHPDLLVADFGPMYVHQWIKDEFGEPTTNYRITLLRPVKAAFNWAVEQPEFDSRLPKNPLKSLKVPKGKPRTHFLSDEEWALVKATATGAFLDLITVMEASGARPQEMRAATAANLNHELRCLFFAEQVKETGNTEPRIIMLDDAAYAICKRLAEQHPEGPIFRNAKGGAWTKDAIGCQCCRIRAKLEKDGHAVEFNVYLLRHRFTQKEQERGTPDSELQHLLGHVDGRMLSTYSKWSKRTKQLRESFDKRRSA